MIRGRYSRLQQGLLFALMWTGLILCIISVLHFATESRALLVSLSVETGVLLVLSLVLIWAIAIASWQQIMQAYGSGPVSVRVSSRHLALLLLGKYIPGGVWGFVARLADSAQRRNVPDMLAAGLTEQYLALVSMSLLATIGLVASLTDWFVFLVAAPFTPAIAIGTLALLLGSLRGMGRTISSRFMELPRSSPRTPQLWRAANLINLQQFLILALVATVASSAFTLSPAETLAVASCYGLAVVAGVVVVFAPGGILVREGVFVALSSEWLSPAESVALAAGLRLVFTLLDLLAGAVAAGVSFGGNRK